MCIIVIKHARVELPASLKNCFNNNPDGAGFMFVHKNQVMGFKGLMTWDAFENKLKAVEKTYGPLKDKLVVFHFRIATHGNVDGMNTHPFPVMQSYKALRQLDWKADIGMAHNGIIHELSTHPDIRDEKVSDTMVFIRRVAAPILNRLDSRKIQDVVDGLGLMASSKLCFLTKGNGIYTFGDFIHDEQDGCFYSNTSYKNERTFRKFRYSDSRYELDWEPEFCRYYYTDDEEAEEKMRDESADEWGYIQLSDDYWFWLEKDDLALDASEDFAIDGSGNLLRWSSGDHDWRCFTVKGTYTLFDLDDNEVWPLED